MSETESFDAQIVEQHDRVPCGIIARPLPTVNVRRGGNLLSISHIGSCQFAKVPGGKLEGLVPARAWGFKSRLPTPTDAKCVVVGHPVVVQTRTILSPGTST